MDETLFTIIGYVVFNVYVVGILGLGILLEKKTRIDKTVCRKLTHVVFAFLWFICYFFFGCSIHWVLLNGIGAAALGVIILGGFMKSYEREDADKSYGIFYFGLSTFVVALVCYLLNLNGEANDLYLFTGIAYYCLALGDGVAPLVVRLFKNFNYKITETRSLVGSLSVFVVSFLSTLGFSLLFGMDLDVLFIFSVAALTCVAEFYGIKGMDNLFIEFSVYGYLLLYHFGLITPLFEIIVLITPFLAVAAIATRSLDVGGGISALVLFFALAFFGDVMPTVYTAVYFVIATVIAVITGRLYYSRKGAERKRHTRTGKQVMAVGIIPIALVVIGYFFDHAIFNVLFYLTVTEQFADSMASDIGRLSKGKNLNIIGFKPVDREISGGVSLLGTTVALFSSFLLPLIPFLFGILSLPQFIAVGVIAFIGVNLDSVLGSLLQALYVCKTCGELVESPTHCETGATLVKGFSIIGNTTVNLLTGVLTCGLGLLILLF